MRISAISNTYNARNTGKYDLQPSFNALIIDKSAMPVIKSMPENDLLEFETIRKRLANSKYWDLKIYSIGNAFKEFKYNFINKLSRKSTITDSIYPYDRIGNKIKFYTIVYGPENSSLNAVDTLEFKTEERAKELYNAYQENNMYIRNRGYNITPLESLKTKEIIFNMLEESCSFSTKEHEAKLINSKSKTKSSTGNDFDYRKK